METIHLLCAWWRRWMENVLKSGRTNELRDFSVVKKGPVMKCGNLNTNNRIQVEVWEVIEMLNKCRERKLHHCHFGISVCCCCWTDESFTRVHSSRHLARGEIYEESSANTSSNLWASRMPAWCVQVHLHCFLCWQ